MRTKISSHKVSNLWQQSYPNTKQPPIKAYYTTKKELNNIADNSQHGKGKFEQNTKKEYGKQKAISSETHNIKGLVYKQGKAHVVLVQRGQSKIKTNKIIRHELNHIKRKD